MQNHLEIFDAPDDWRVRVYFYSHSSFFCKRELFDLFLPKSIYVRKVLVPREVRKAMMIDDQRSWKFEGLVGFLTFQSVQIEVILR